MVRVTALPTGHPRLHGIDPAAIAKHREAGWPEFHPETYCHRCGAVNAQSWTAPSELFNLAADTVEIICPPCFTNSARPLLRTRHWIVMPEAFTGPTATFWRYLSQAVAVEFALTGKATPWRVARRMWSYHALRRNHHHWERVAGDSMRMRAEAASGSNQPGGGHSG